MEYDVNEVFSTFYYLFYYLAAISTTVEVAVDIDDCASFPCGFDNECFDEVNGYTCSCTTGYAPDSTSTQCTGLSQSLQMRPKVFSI